LLSIFLLPALPTIIGALLGTLLTVATARMKKSSLASVVAQMVLVFALMFVSLKAVWRLKTEQTRKPCGDVSTDYQRYDPPHSGFRTLFRTDRSFRFYGCCY
jgi:hypothetical protein